MLLEMPGVQPNNEPTEKDVAEAFEALQNNPRDDEFLDAPPDNFIMLTDDRFDWAFMQTILVRGGFQVDYRDSETRKLFRSEKPLSKEAAVAVFQSYLRGTGYYLTACVWRDITGEMGSWPKSFSDWVLALLFRRY